MTNLTPSYLTIGKIGAPFGVRGWVKVHSFAEFGETILNFKEWYLPDGKDEYRMVTVEDGRAHGKGYIVKLQGFDTPEEVALLTGKLIDIPRTNLPTLKKDEFYWSDLVGLTVINKEGVIYGKVIYLIATGSNDVLVVKGEKEHGIPCLFGDVILSVDLIKREIIVDWELI